MELAQNRLGLQKKDAATALLGRPEILGAHTELYLGRTEQPPSAGHSAAVAGRGGPLVKPHALYDLILKHFAQPRRPLPPNSTGRRIPDRGRCRAFNPLKRLGWFLRRACAIWLVRRRFGWAKQGVSC